MNDKLRECPICNSSARLIKASEDKRRQTNKIYCTNRPCISITRAAMHGEEDITRIWNTRHQPKYETINEWETRTGETYPENKNVLVLSLEISKWVITEYLDALEHQATLIYVYSLDKPEKK